MAAQEFHTRIYLCPLLGTATRTRAHYRIVMIGVTLRMTGASPL